MRKWKVAAVLLLLSLMAFLLSGCGESFVYKTYTDSLGGIHKEYIFTYDKDASDAATVKEQAVKIMRRYVMDMAFEEYAVVDDSEEGEVVLSLYFPSVTDYDIAIGRTGREKPEREREHYEGLFVVSEAQLDSYLEEQYIEYVRKLADEEYADFPLEGTFYYVYGTPYKVITSNVEATEIDGVYYHTWRLYPDAPTEMWLRAYSLNGILLYASIILLFVLSLATIFVIIYIKKKKRRNMRA